MVCCAGQDYNQRMDMLMEVDRLKDLQERERVEVGWVGLDVTH